MKPQDLLQALCVVLIWGFNYVAIKLTVAEIPPLTLTFLRFGATAAIILPFFRLPFKTIKKIVPVALVLGVGHFGLFFIGLRGADAATVALLLQLGVPFSSILAAVFFADKLGLKRGVGMALAFCGAAFLIGEPQGGTPLAIICTLICAFCWAWANILIKKLQDIPPLAIIGWMSFLAMPVIAIMSFAWENSQVEAIKEASINAWLFLSYTVIGSSLFAYRLWYGLIKRLDVNQIVPFSLLAPLIGVGAGVVLLNEAFTLYKILGGMMTISGVGIILFREAIKKKQHTTG